MSATGHCQLSQESCWCVKWRTAYLPSLSKRAPRPTEARFYGSLSMGRDKMHGVCLLAASAAPILTCYRPPKIVLDGHRSFPSGHSSAAWAGMTFVFLLLAGKTGCFRSNPSFPPRSWTGSALLRISLTISPLFLAAWIAITRLEDYVSTTIMFRMKGLMTVFR